MAGIPAFDARPDPDCRSNENPLWSELAWHSVAMDDEDPAMATALSLRRRAVARLLPALHHTHRVEPKDGGTPMTDVVRHRLPFGIIGRAMHFCKSRRDVERIFDCRFRRIQEFLGDAVLVEAK